MAKKFKPQLLVFADSHMQETAWQNSAVRGDAAFGLKQVIDVAIERQVKYVIGAGDLIDKQRNRSAPITLFMKEIDRLRKAGIGFYFIQGQHDFDTPPWLSGHAWAKWLNGKTIKRGNLEIYGLDWHPYGSLQEALAAIPHSTNVLIAHQTWADWMGDITSPQGEHGEVPHASLLISGDYHQYRDDWTRGVTGQKLRAVSPGALCMQEISEPCEHFCVLVGEDFQIEKVKLRSRMTHERVLNSTEDLEKFLGEVEGDLELSAAAADAAKLPDELVKPLMRVVYGYNVQDAVRRIENAVKGRAHLFWKELPPPEKESVEVEVGRTEKRRGEAVTPQKMLPNEINPQEDPDAYGLALRLLQSPDPQGEFVRWRQEFMTGAK